MTNSVQFGSLYILMAVMLVSGVLMSRSGRFGRRFLAATGWLALALRTPHMRYPVVIHKDPQSAYGVTIPDLPGVFTMGDTIAEALANVNKHAGATTVQLLPRIAPEVGHLTLFQRTPNWCFPMNNMPMPADWTPTWTMLLI